MRNHILTALLIFAILLSGCMRGTTDVAEPPEVQEPVINTPVAEPAPVNKENNQNDELLNGLNHNLYSGIEMSADVLPRAAIHPGSTVPVTVVISNTGDKTVVYTHGSGSADTPEAMHVRIPGLQPILPKDWLGAVTADFQSKELKPGETLNFTTFVRAIEPHASFNEYTHSRFTEQGTYIGDVEWEELQSLHTGLTAAAAGSFTGHAFFRYYVLDEGDEMDLTREAEGYASTEFTITIDETVNDNNDTEAEA